MSIFKPMLRSLNRNKNKSNLVSFVWNKDIYKLKYKKPTIVDIHNNMKLEFFDRYNCNNIKNSNMFINIEIRVVYEEI